MSRSEDASYPSDTSMLTSSPEPLHHEGYCTLRRPPAGLRRLVAFLTLHVQQSPCVEYLTFIKGIYSDSTLAFFNDVIEVNWCSITSLRYWHTLLVSFQPLQPHIPLKDHVSGPSMQQPANVKLNFLEDTQDSLKWQPDCIGIHGTMKKYPLEFQELWWSTMVVELFEGVIA
ncbi:hypothetical protein M422DRAFT_239271 [Sphaerobolus stellatus SS14]|nr:hypothetical protein M422DRAFT_239271 [Sphaerobolus stellatus SS14]